MNETFQDTPSATPVVQTSNKQRIVAPQLSLPSRTTTSITAQSSSNVDRQQQAHKYPAELIALLEAETAILPIVTPHETTTTSSRHKRFRQQRVPDLRQVTAVECGAACLTMILNYYGHRTSITEVQEKCGAGRDGLTALSIVKSARNYGLQVRAVSLKLADLQFVTLPAIIHWEFNHFIIVERYSAGRIDVVDPAVGRRHLTNVEFDAGFTGIVIMLEPGVHFTRVTHTKSLTLWTYLRSFLSTHTTLLQIFCASLLLQVLGLSMPVFTELIVDYILPSKALNILTMLGLGMLLIILMQGVTLLLRTALLIYLQTSIDTNLMLNFVEHLLSLPYRFFQLRLNGDLLARINSNIEIRNLLTNQLLSALLDGSTVITYLIILFCWSWRIATITLVPGLLQIGILLLTAPTLRSLTLRDLETQGKTQGYLNEVLSGIATLKAAGAEQQAFRRWKNLFFMEMNTSLRLQFLSSSIAICLELINLLSSLLLLWVGALQVLNGTLSIGAMLALTTLASLFLSPLRALINSGQDLQIVRAHFARISDVVTTRSEQDIHQVRTPHRLTGQIQLRKVSFQYEPAAPMILQNINMNIYPGQKIALVGKTGSGKSTLGKLLVGLMTPTGGSILFDAVPLETLNYQEVRSQFGVVLQESTIFSGTIRENIALNHTELTLSQISEAAQTAVIAQEIQKMPMEYETYVSEGGSVFSGGQRQRLALARALANRPALLLLDEATSALDVATEHQIEQNLNRLACTQIIIAHRLSTIQNADVIFVLDQGHIMEQGTHKQLLQQNGFYADLIRTQLQNNTLDKPDRSG